MTDEVKSNIKIESLGMPGMGRGQAGVPKADYDGYRIRYMKVDMDDPASVFELEQIETRGITTDEVVVLSRTTFSCMTSFFFIVTYLEKTETAGEYKVPEVKAKAMPRPRTDVNLDDSSQYVKGPKTTGDGDILSF